MKAGNVTGRHPQTTLHIGDCRDVLATMDADSVDAIVTDPPAGIHFMGRDWDSNKGGRDEWVSWLAGVMREALRVAKPGAHALVWSLPRTSGWTHRALEDAGWEVRDAITHITGQGFPKSLDIGKALDKMAGADREVIGTWKPGGTARIKSTIGARTSAAHTGYDDSEIRKELPVTAPATDLARQWDGWGTALKPSAEIWYLARKPFAGTVAANVATYGTGGLNIDACRIDVSANDAEAMDRCNTPGSGRFKAVRSSPQAMGRTHASAPLDTTLGRWPANLIIGCCGNDPHDEGCAVRLLDEQSGERGNNYRPNRITGQQTRHGTKFFDGIDQLGTTFSGSGGASRFFKQVTPDTEASRMFYAPKASRAERGEGNTHPCVKNLSLMRYLCRLITPPDGLILDMFCGSGTTGVAAVIEGFRFVGIEQDETYAEIAERRIAHATPPLFRTAAD